MARFNHGQNIVEHFHIAKTVSRYQSIFVVQKKAKEQTQGGKRYQMLLDEVTLFGFQVI